MSSDLTETVTVKGEAITVSLLIWRRFRRPMPGMAARILDLNTGLADLGVHIPVGTEVVIPIPTEGKAEVLAPIKLW